MKTLSFKEKIEVQQSINIEIPYYAKKKWSESMVMITDEKTVTIHKKLLVFEVEPSEFLIKDIIDNQYVLITEEEFKTAYLQAKKMFLL